MTLPLAIFADCEAARDQPVAFFTQPDGTLLVQWQDNGVPIVRTAKQPDFDAGFPELPEETHDVSVGFLSALCDAMQTVERDALRYATNCVQLCGATGRMLATDSRQALVVSGFEFPWDDQLLLPWNGVFGLKELLTQEAVRIGRRDDRLALTLGPWTLHFTLETERRFPRIDDCIPVPDSAKTTLTISDGDADFAAKAISDLPKLEFDESVTVDLNGTVAFRAKSDGPATELVLTNSRRDGLPSCFVTDRRILQRALQLGFREFRLISAEHAIVSSDGNRTFVWMPLAPPDPVRPGARCVRIESPASSPAPSQSAVPQTRPFTRSSPQSMRKSQPQPQANGHETDAPANGAAANGAAVNGAASNSAASNSAVSNSTTSNGAGPVEEAEALRETLKTALSQTTALIASLKLHRQQTKKFRTAVQSLRELQAIDT
jgi:hypothetical protein